MKCLIFLFTFVCVSSTLAQTSNESGSKLPAESAKSSSTRSPFTSAEGGFSIALPGSPPRAGRSFDGRSDRVDYFEYTWPTNLGTYTVRYMEASRLGANRFQGTMALGHLRDALVNRIKGRLLHESEIMLGNHPGREIIIEDGSGLYLQRFYVVGPRVYDVSAYLPQALRAEQRRALRVLNSFSLTNPPPMEAGEVDSLLRSLREKGEIVLGNCGKGSTCQPLTDLENSSRTDLGEVKAGKITSQPEPEYPAIAKAARASGTVPVWVVVSEEGKVIAAQVLAGHPLLRDPALKAAREAQFTPTLFNGKPVKVKGIINYHFFLR